MGEENDQGRVQRAVGSSVRGNSTAFGFSIMITASFGVLSHLRGSPDLLKLFLFGIAAAAAVAILEAIVTRGFQIEIEQVSQPVDLLGTAMNFASVAAAVAAATGMAELLDGTVAWPAASFAAAGVFVLSESAEIFLAELLQGEEGSEEEDGGAPQDEQES